MAGLDGVFKPWKGKNRLVWVDKHNWAQSEASWLDRMGG